MNLWCLILFGNILGVNTLTVCNVLRSFEPFQASISPLPTKLVFFNSFENISESRVLKYILAKCPGSVPEIVNRDFQRHLLMIDCTIGPSCIRYLGRLLNDSIVDGQVSRRCFIFVLSDSDSTSNRILSTLLLSKWSSKVHGTIVKLSSKNGELLSFKLVRPLLNSCSVSVDSLSYSRMFDMKLFVRNLLGPNRKCNFKGKTLTAAITKSAFCDFDIHPNRTLILRPSVDLNVLRALQQTFNFTVQGIDAKGDYGDRDPNGTWTGLIGMAVNGRADVALCDLIYTYDRIRVLDFECPWTVEPVTFLTKAPGFQDRKWQFVEVFPAVLWATIAVLILLLWGFLYIFDRSSSFSYGFLLLSVALFQSFTNLAQKHLKEFKPRLLVGLWALIAFILAQLYIGIFHSRITIPARGSVLDSVSDVRRAAETDRAFVFTTRYLRNMAFRAECCHGFYWSLGEHLRRNPMPPDIAALESKMDSLNSYQWHPDRPLVFITSTRILHLYSAYATTPVHISQASFMYDVLGLAIQKDALFGGHFAMAIRRLLECGFFVHWNKQMISEHRARGRIIQKQNLDRNSAQKPESKLRVFRLEELQSVFILYTICNLIAIFVFLVQNVYFRYKQWSNM